jgi:hypothetical protein
MRLSALAALRRDREQELYMNFEDIFLDCAIVTMTLSKDRFDGSTRATKRF